VLGSTHFYYTNKWKIEKKNEGFPILEMVVVLLRTGIMGLTGRAKCNDTLAQSNVGERETRREMKSGELLVAGRKRAHACILVGPLPPLPYLPFVRLCCRSTRIIKY